MVTNLLYIEYQGVTMREIEKRVQEKRAIEAAKKKLMGFTGKLGCIARNMGQVITVHTEGGGGHEIHHMDDPYALPTDDDPLELKAGYAREIMEQIPVDAMGEEIDEPTSPEWGERQEQRNSATYDIGWYFDGLSRGMHLEIKFDDYQKVLTASYQGYEVYREAAGELLTYAPSPDWEDKVEQLYAVAKTLDKYRKKLEREEEILAAKAEKTSWWNNVKKRWGL